MSAAARKAEVGQLPVIERQVTASDLSRMALKDEADEIVFKSLAVSKCLQYARKELQDDDGETVDGVVWVLNDNLRRLQQIVAQLEKSP